MKRPARIVSMLWAVVAVFSMQSAMAGDGEDSMILSLTMSKKSYEVGEPIICSVELKNMGASNVKVLNHFLLENLFLRLDILDEKGERVMYVGDVLTLGHDRSWLVELRPDNWIGQSVQVYGPEGPTADQVGQYDLGHAGRYTATAVYSIVRAGPWWQGEIKSAPVRFEVRGPAAD